MLEEQLWMNYDRELLIEWRQMKDEGKNVDDLRHLCTLVAEKALQKNCMELAVDVYRKMSEAPQVPEYPYVEPSDLYGIVQKKPSKRHHFTCELNSEELLDKISGAWIGRISGCLLGKPVECMKTDILHPLLKKTDNYPMHKYIMQKDFTPETEQLLKDWHNHCWADTLNGIAPVDDDTNYTVLALKLLENYGRDFRPNDVIEAWLSWVPMFATCTAERVAYRNAATGMYAPETATYLNPYREWIGAQIRGDFFGYINPGNTEMASEMAWRDASISHIKNGIYGEMFVAAMIAAAYVSDDVMTVIEAGVDEIPEKSRLRADIDKVIHWYQQGKTEEDVIREIHSIWDENNQHDWCHTCSNAMIVTMALLYGEKDFGKTVCLAVQAGFDTDCNGATAGSVIGCMLGENKIPVYWFSCYGKQLATSIDGYNRISVDKLAEKTFCLISGKK